MRHQSSEELNSCGRDGGVRGAHTHTQQHSPRGAKGRDFSAQADFSPRRNTACRELLVRSEQR